MRENQRIGRGITALKVAGVVCFWLAMAVVLTPAADMAAPVAADGGAAVAAGTVGALEVVTPQSQKLIPLGRTTGIKMFSEGTMIVGFAELEQNGGKSPALLAGLAIGDVIVAVNDVEIRSTEDLQNQLAAMSQGDMVITAKRDGQAMQFNVKAIYDSEKATWRTGAWVRDSIAGIGTITFVDPENGAFGALGHGISDTDTGQLMTIEKGSIMESTVTGVNKGEAGAPGELKGSFNLAQDQGVLYSNTGKGIFGQITNSEVYAAGEAMELAAKSEIAEGKAYILSNVEGQEIRRYEIEVVKIYAGSDDSARDMMIRVVDESLIAITGGIVQGMSGSPIIQNGKIIGAVTHVLINDPLRGYGISIENMIAQTTGA